jgi:hypothetical protein
MDALRIAILPFAILSGAKYLVAYRSTVVSLSTRLFDRRLRVAYDMTTTDGLN